MSWIGITNYKLHSTRCPNKHFLPFYKDKTLVDIKIEQLLQAGAEHVFVSTNDRNVTDTSNITYINRDEKYCDETQTTFPEVMQEIFNTVPVSNDKNALFTFTMCPLFDRYAEMYSKFIETGNNQLAVHPSKHYYLNANKRGANFMFGAWHPYSQDIEPMYQMPYCGVLAKMSEHRKVGYTIPTTFDFFEIKTFENFDIDTKEEFEICQLIYNWRKKNKTL